MIRVSAILTVLDVAAIENSIRDFSDYLIGIVRTAEDAAADLGETVVRAWVRGFEPGSCLGATRVRDLDAIDLVDLRRGPVCSPIILL
jgi:hypothetical protein